MDRIDINLKFPGRKKKLKELIVFSPESQFVIPKVRTICKPLTLFQGLAIDLKKFFKTYVYKSKFPEANYKNLIRIFIIEAVYIKQMKTWKSENLKP